MEVLVRYAILGPVELCDAERRVGVSGQRQVALLALLLLNANCALSYDRLIDALWADLGPAGALKRLQAAILRLRRTLDRDGVQRESVLQTVAGGYLLAVRPGELDAEVFETRIEQGRRALDGGDVVRARDVLGQALGIWRGNALATLVYEQFAQPEIRRLEELRLIALETRLDCALRLGEHVDVIAELDALVAAHPGRERLAAQLMLALYRCGRQGDALAVYARTRAYLSGELGLEPGPALQSLQHAILKQAPSLDLKRFAGNQSAASARDSARFVALPSAVAAGAEDPFVGRAADLEALAGVYAQVAAGSRRLVLLGGEPGIGKTRLATQFAVRAHDTGATVLNGRCDEEGLLALQPFVEALRHYVDVCPVRQLAGRLGSGSGELRRMLPELADRIANLPEPLAGDPEGARSRLFEAVSALLCEASQSTPIVLVLEDLHWADSATLLLLKYLVRYPRKVRVLVLATYRDTELSVDHPLSRTLTELGRERLLEQRALMPLDGGAVSQLVDAHAGDRASPELHRIVYEATEGNAFFVVEVMRHFAESGALDDTSTNIAAGRLTVPDSVKGVISQRLARLGSKTAGLLVMASVLGRAFERDLLERLSALDEGELVDRLESGVRARVIEEVAGAPGRFMFSHALIRETLYGELSATRRAPLHRRAGAALEQAHAAALEPYLAQLAYHFARSIGDLDKAIEYGTRAGEHAISLAAYEQAAAHFRQTIELIDTTEPRRKRRRCDLVIAQGEAERQGGDQAYRQTLLDGARLARQLGDPDRLARAALANNRGAFTPSIAVDRERVAVLHAALDAYDSSDSPTRAALLSLLALELLWDDNWRLRERLSDDALAMARRVGDRRVLALVLTQRSAAQWRPQTLPELRSGLREACLLADRLQDPLLAGHTAFLGALAAMEVGDLEHADRLLAQLSAVAEQLSQPLMRWYAAAARAKRCLISGPAEQAERLAFAARELARSAQQGASRPWL